MSQAIDLKQTAELLLANDSFAIICHASPDGDTLGGAYALCGALQKIGKRAKVILPEAASRRFDYLLSAVEVQEFDEEFAVTVDVADSELLGDLKEKYKNPDLCIDHHISNTGYAKNLLLDSDAAAACEVVFRLIKLFGANAMSADIAACLYTGISTDTGCFKFSNTSADSHRLTAELMEYGFDCAGLNYLLFEMRTKERLALERIALESVEMHFDGRCAMISLTKEAIGAADDEDMNAISALSRQIEGVEAGVTLKEKEENVWKASVRTKSYMNAQVICASFGGGGHQRASGCKLNGTLEECKKKLLEEIKKHM
jgi:phosphoesterase RecJ-like protein